MMKMFKRFLESERQKQVKKGIVALESWINLATKVIDAAEKRSNSTLDKWLNRINNYQGINYDRRDDIDAIL